MKKKTLFLLVALLLINLFPFTVQAESQTIVYCEDFVAENVGDNYDIIAEYVDADKFISELREVLLKCEPSIDVSEYNIPASSDFFSAVSGLIRHEMYDMFHVDAMGYSYGDTIGELFFYYDMTAEEFASMHEAYTKEVERMVSGIKGNDSLSEMEKALLLHDRLALECEYDYTLSKYSAYDALINDTAVCQGYALAYELLLNQVGIKNEYVSSTELNHGWNIVYIDGKPYHVDVTWDDIAWSNGGRGVLGYVAHDNFLRSTDGITETGHTATDFTTTPTDTTYDWYFWSDNTSAFMLVGDEIYYIDHVYDELKRYSDDAVLCSVEDHWSAGGNKIWKKNYSKLATDGTDLYYSLAKAVYKYDISEGTTSVVYQPELETEVSIYGMAYKDGYLICDVNTAPPFSGGSSLDQLKYRISQEETSISVIEGSGYSKTEDYLLGVSNNTTVSELLSGFDNNDLVVKDVNGNILGETDVCGTGCKVELVYDGVVIESIDVVVSGDVDGNGRVNSTDYILIRNICIGTTTIGGAAFIAADVGNNGRIDSTDCLIIKSNFV